MRKVVLIAYSEIGLKSSRTRKKFEDLLVHNLEKACGNINVTRERGRIYLAGEDCERLAERARFVFGVKYCAVAHMFGFSALDDVAKAVSEMYKNTVKDKRFRITARRTGAHRFTSMDVQKAVGRLVELQGGTVDLKNHDVEIFVEIRGNSACVYDRILSGPGGLPVGAEGNVAVLFSGGIDSPVAAWMMMKRGCMPLFVHINLGGKESLNHALNVCRKLCSAWMGGMRPDFIVVNGGKIAEEIKKRVRPAYRQVVLKRAMYAIAERLSGKYFLDAVVTGESVGQVSTQTLKNLKSLDDGMSVMMLRPLIGLDKDEIISLAKKIGTYEESKLTGELCNISSGPVKTSAVNKSLMNEYAKISSIVEELVVGGDGCETFGIGDGLHSSIKIPKEFELIDLDKQKIDYRNVCGKKFYVVVCKDGILASRECDMLKEMGIPCIGIKRRHLRRIANIGLE